MTRLRDRNPYMEAVWKAQTKHDGGRSFSCHSKLTVSAAFFNACLKSLWVSCVASRVAATGHQLTEY